MTTFDHLIDLAAEAVGGEALYATDEFFAEKENLLKPGRGEYIADRFTDNGKWMDGWESRRKRVPGHDFCIVRLGIPGVVRGVDVDTNHFTGNYPEHASLEGLSAPADATVAQLLESTWTPLVPISRLEGGSRNLFSVASEERFTHVRLHIYPDGGVARLRVHGEARPDWEALGSGLVDLAAAVNGARVALTNDQFFGHGEQVIYPGEPRVMREGWETRRKRGPGNDWLVVQLAGRGTLERLQVDTTHFKGNYPDSCSLEGIDLSQPVPDDFLGSRTLKWTTIVRPQKMQAHHSHVFESLETHGPFTHVRLSIYPDGGVARLRLFGRRA